MTAVYGSSMFLSPFEQKHHEASSLRAVPSNPQVYQNLRFVKKLSDSKFPVYLMFSETCEQYFAMKIFPYSKDQPHPYFSNEVRFNWLNHPNIVSFLHYEKEKKTVHRNQVKKVSYILMEYAPYGDFLSLISNHASHFDEKLVRTYFKQLIDGVDYLHRNGITHLDLKPDNLLLDSKFNLKITDFDLSYIEGDDEVLGQGSKSCRAPELFRSSGSKASYAADIYSAGIILFLLKSGGNYPFTEEEESGGSGLSDFIKSNNKKFWDFHCQIEEKEDSFYDDSFRYLFNQMVKENADERITIEQIKKSEWYNGPIYSPEELCDKMEDILYC